MFDQRLTQGFSSLLMKYLPKLFCFEVKPDSLYARTDFISLLVNASMLNCYLDGLGYASRDLGGRVPTGETALSYIKSIDRYELESVTWILLEEQLNELKVKGLLNRPVPIAFDWNDQMFYGDENTTDMVNGTKPKDGSSYAYQYLTASILVDGRRLTIALIPIKSREHLLDYVGYALDRITAMGVMVRYFVFDGGFSSLELPAYLEKRGFRYLIRFTPNRVTKRMNLKDGESARYPCDGQFRVVRVDDRETGMDYLFITNMTCGANRLLKRYKRRWGVETSYRMHNSFLAKTTSKNYVVRLLYYAVAVCIYNAWCLFNTHGTMRKAKHLIVLQVRLLVILASFLGETMATHHPPT